MRLIKVKNVFGNEKIIRSTTRDFESINVHTCLYFNRIRVEGNEILKLDYIEEYVFGNHLLFFIKANNYSSLNEIIGKYGYEHDSKYKTAIYRYFYSVIGWL